MINPMGTVWTLGRRVCISLYTCSSIVNLGYLNQLGNYGEYSGKPYKNKLVSNLKLNHFLNSLKILNFLLQNAYGDKFLSFPWRWNC